MLISYLIVFYSPQTGSQYLQRWMPDVANLWNFTRLFFHMQVSYACSFTPCHDPYVVWCDSAYLPKHETLNLSALWSPPIHHCQSKPLALPNKHVGFENSDSCDLSRQLTGHSSSSMLEPINWIEEKALKSKFKSWVFLPKKTGFYLLTPFEE